MYYRPETGSCVPPLTCAVLVSSPVFVVVDLGPGASLGLELKELSFFLIFIILHALFNAPMCVDSENLCMGSPALLKKVRTPSKK